MRMSHHIDGWELLQQRAAQLAHERRAPLPRRIVLHKAGQQDADASQRPSGDSRISAVPQ